LGAAELGAVEPGAAGGGDAAASGLELGAVELGGEENNGVAAGLGETAGGLGVAGGLGAVGTVDWARAVWISANGIQNKPNGDTTIARRETTGERWRAIDLAVESLDGLPSIVPHLIEFSDRDTTADSAKIKFFLSKYLFKHKICRLYIF
jgi:hypothetical protein